MWTPEHRRFQRAADAARRRYPSDVTDAEWALIEPLLGAPARLGRRRTTDMREVVSTLRYLVRAGCGWRMMPVHFGTWQTICWWFPRLTRRLLLAMLHEVVVMLDRELAGR